jgi:hypothetical protein
MVKSSLSTDEALARALQNEYEQEYRSSQSQSAVERPPPTAPLSNRTRGTNARMTSEQEDEAYARRLEKELREQESSAGFERSSTQPSSRSSSADVGHLTDDEAYARRVEQELEDERVARRISSQEEQRVSRQRATVVAAASPNRSPVRRLCGCLIPLVVIGGIAAGLYYLFGNNGIPGFPNNWSDFSQEDPFNQTTPDLADRWRNNGSGLSLEVLNALDDKWYEFFYQAIGDWDDGTPDVLSLTTSVRTPDGRGECASVDGKIKVCNFDYGQTNWRGMFSEVLMSEILCSHDRVFIFKLSHYYYLLFHNTQV